MARTLTMPANRAMRLAPDCWETVIDAAIAKGVNPSDVVAGLIRTQTENWLGCSTSPQTQPAITPATPFNAVDALDNLIDSL